MSSPVKDFVEHFVNPAREGPDLDDGVEGNSRLTAALGAVLFVALAVEGLTLLVGVREMIVVHVFVGFLVLPLAVVKIGSTSYRMARYYLRDARYRHKGPPHPVLRVLGPLVVLSTAALLATGIATIAMSGPSSRDMGGLHQTSFFIWVVLMSIHVLGHLVETARYSAGDWMPRRARVARSSMRRGVVIATVLAGIGLGFVSIAWAHDWRTMSESIRSSEGARRDD